MLIKRGYKRLFKENGFADFDSFMGFSGGEVLKKISVRSITKFYLSRDGHKIGFYLKRHSQKPRLSTKVKGLLKKPSPSEARIEFEAAEALAEAKVPCALAAAFGERSTNQKVESFLVTEALDGYTQLEKMVFDFAPPLTKAMIEKKRALIDGVAKLASSLHRAGFNHKDLYLTHILAKFEEPAGYSLKLIDLQRVEHRTSGRRRWLVKDIAALNYSSPAEIITRTDRLRFYKAYTARQKLGKAERAFIKSVTEKTARIAVHTVKMYKRREERKKRGLLER
ncbi:MAG: lipopolysaccharide kinase InaA family protein [Thermodesulfobacteriota bacterium]